MGDSPKPITSSDGSDTEALIRVAVTPGPGIRPKRSSIVNSASQSGSGLDAVPTAEDLLVETLLAIEGDDISYDVFQFVLEMVRIVKSQFENFCLVGRVQLPNYVAHRLPHPQKSSPFLFLLRKLLIAHTRVLPFPQSPTESEYTRNGQTH